MAEIHAIGSGKLHIGQLAYCLYKKALLLVAEDTREAALLNHIVENGVAKVFLEVSDMVIRNNQHFGHGKILLLEVLCHIYEGIVLLNRRAHHPDKRRLTR